jgi:hypothetical protein
MERNIKTRVKDGAEPQVTKVTIDFGSFTEADIRELAAKSLVIEAQSDWRKAGSIPAEATITSAEYGPSAPRAKRGPVDVGSLLAKMSPEERAALLAKFA